ncbi:MAG: c-type cytochrome [Bryobacteraceae bacterium]|nr:c-type cytochrome [Bryobacteraceae bacterium]
MRKLFLRGGLVAAAVAICGIAYLILTGPEMQAAPDIKVPMTAERIERGRYLFENVAHCTGCHSPRDWGKFSAPVNAGTVGSGVEFPAELGLPGRIVATNLTPDPETGLGNWTDGEKIRAIREGVSRDGRPLFPFMPYPSLSKLCDEDVEAIVAYMNTLKPVKNRLPQTKLDFPVSLMAKFAPKPVHGKVTSPSRSDRLAYGRYLVTIGDCAGCHTPKERGKDIEGKEYAGGMEFPIAGMLVRSANITPDEETGIGTWTEERFVSQFKGHAEKSFETAPKAVQANFTLMGWMDYSKMQEEDLRAIYTYLRTLKPVHNPVERHPPVAN